MVRITERTLDDVMVIALRGRLTAGCADAAVCDRIRHVLFRGYRRIVVDLASAASSDASGVSALLGALLDATVSGAEVRLANASALDDLQIVTALLRYFDAYDSEADALDGFVRNATTASGATGTRRALEGAAEHHAAA
jgi:anti-anti-sigma regulatory factor